MSEKGNLWYTIGIKDNATKQIDDLVNKLKGVKDSVNIDVKVGGDGVDKLKELLATVEKLKQNGTISINVAGNAEQVLQNLQRQATQTGGAFQDAGKSMADSTESTARNWERLKDIMAMANSEIARLNAAKTVGADPSMIDNQIRRWESIIRTVKTAMEGLDIPESTLEKKLERQMRLNRDLEKGDNANNNVSIKAREEELKLLQKIEEVRQKITELEQKQVIQAANGQSTQGVTNSLAEYRAYLDVLERAKGSTSDTTAALNNHSAKMKELASSSRIAQQSQADYNKELTSSRQVYQQAHKAMAQLALEMEKIKTARAKGNGGTFLDDAERKAKALMSQLEHIVNLSGKMRVNAWNSAGVGSEMSQISSLRALQEQTNKTANANANLGQSHQNAGQQAKQHTEHTKALTTQMRTTTQIATVLGNALGNVFGVYAIRNFLNDIIKVGGELERQHLALQAIIGDAQKADVLFQQVSALSMKSPFDVQDMIQYTKQLAAFGIEYDKLYDTTKRLSDVAAGVGVSFGRIAYEFGQTSSRGWLDGRELRMFANSGIPLLEKLSKLYSEQRGETVTASMVREMVTARQVSFEDVEKVIKQMTDEGGEFFNMQEKMADSLASKWRNLANSWNLMSGTIAESGFGSFLKWVAEILTKMTNSWEYVAAAIAGVTTALLYNKAASNMLLAADAKRLAMNNATSIALRRNIVLYGKWSTMMRGFGNISKSVANTIKANMGGIVVGAILSVGLAIAQAYKQWSEYNDIIDGVAGRISEQAEDSVRGFDYLLNKLNDAKDNQAEYSKVIDQMRNKYGDYLENLREEASAYGDIAAQADNARAKIREKIREQEVEKSLGKVSEKYSEDLDNIRKNMRYDARFWSSDLKDTIVNDLISFVDGKRTFEEISKAIRETFPNNDKAFDLLLNGNTNFALAFKDYIKTYKKLVDDENEILNNAGGTSPYDKIVAPIKDLYNDKISKINDLNEIEKLRLKMNQDIITALTEGQVEIDGVIYKGAKNGLVSMYSNAAEEISKVLTKDWQNIARTVLGEEFTGAVNGSVNNMTSIIRTDLNATKMDNDALKQFEEWAKKYKELTEDIEKRKKLNLADPDSLKTLEYQEEELRRLNELANQLGINWEDFQKAKKKDSGKDTFKEEMQNQIRLLKEAYKEYNDWYDLLANEGAAGNKVKGNKGLAELYSSRGFGSNFNPSAIADNLKTLREKIAAANEGGKYDNLLINIDNELYNIDKDQFKDNIAKAISELEVVLEKQTRDWNIYRKLFETTGDENWSRSIAQGGARIFDEVAEMWNEMLAKKLRDNNIDVSGVDDFYGMDEKAAEKLFGGKNEIYELWKKTKARIEDEGINYYGDVATIRKNAQSAAEQYSAMYDKYMDRREKMMKSGATQSELNSLDTQFASESAKTLLAAISQENTGSPLSMLLTGKLNGSITETQTALKQMAQVIDYLNEADPNKKSEKRSKISFLSDESLSKLQGNGAALVDMANAYAQADSIFSKLSSNGFSGIVKGIGELVDYEKKINAINKQIDNLDKNSDDYESNLESLTNNKKALNEKKLQSFAGAVASVAEAFGDCAEQVRNYAQEIGDSSLEEWATSLSTSMSILGSTAQGAATGGWIGAIIGFVTSATSALTNSIIQSKTYMHQVAQSAKDYARSIELLKLSINEDDYNSIFGTDALGKAMDAYSTATASLKKFQETMSSKSDNPLFGDFLDGLSDVLGYWSSLQTMLVKTKDSPWWDLFGRDEYTTLGSLAPEMFEGGQFNADAAKAFLETNTQLTDEQRKQIQYAIDLKDAYDEATNALDDYLSNMFGNMSSSMTDAIFDGVLNGADAWEQFEQAGSDAVLNVAKSMVNSMIVQSYLNQFQSKMEDAFANGYGEDVTHQLVNIMGDMMQGLPAVLEAGTAVAEEINRWATENGYDLSGSSDSMQASIQGVTEQTADILAAYMNAMRLDLSVQRSVVENIGNVQLPELSATASAQLAQLNMQTEYLRQIQESSAIIQDGVQTLSEDIHGAVIGTKSISVQ